MKWQLGDELDNRITEYDGWLNLIDIAALDEQGVFVFVSEGVEVLYVGYAPDNLAKEIKTAVNQGKALDAAMYSWYITGSEGDSMSLKQYWLEKYKPVNNQ